MNKAEKTTSNKSDRKKNHDGCGVYGSTLVYFSEGDSPSRVLQPVVMSFNR